MKVFLKNKIVSLDFVLGLMIGLASFLGFSVLFNNHSVLAYSLTVSSSGAQSIDVAPKNGDTGTSINADSITVATDCRNGYDFAISASVNDNNLYLGGDSNNNSSNTFFTPSNGSTALKNAPNTWGYYFNASAPTTAPTSSSVFNSVPVVGSPVSLITERTTPSSTDISDNFNIYYGVAVSSTMPVGTYKMIPDANDFYNNGVIVYYATMAKSCIPYTVQFNPTSTAGGTTVSGTGTMNPQEMYKDVATALTTNGFTAPSGYEFKEWNTAQDGTGTSYTDGESVTNLATPGNTITLYAQWELLPQPLYDLVAAMSKGKQTMADLQQTITIPTSSDRVEDSSNSGVYEYDPTEFGVSSDASNDYAIYYYRGVLEDDTSSYGSNGSSITYPNYVILQVGNNKSTADTCWRIIRTTGSGGVKMIYNGTWTGSTCANSQTDTQVSTSAFSGDSSTYQQIVRIGYTYNDTYATNTAQSATIAQVFGSNVSPSVNNTRSTIKEYIEDIWYANNMSTWTSILESSAGYCNDRSIYDNGSPYTQQSESTSIITYGTDSMTPYNFGSYIRNSLDLAQNGNRSLTLNCPRNTVDLYHYVANSTGASNELKYPVALLTADEASFVGSGSITASRGSAYNKNSFLRSGLSFWLLSPSGRDSRGDAYGLVLYPSGYVGYGNDVHDVFGVRPAISLVPGTVTISGSGIATDPWVVEPGPQLISFTVGGVAYQAEENMTWGKWAESTYNTSDIVVEEYGRMWDDAQGKWVTADPDLCGDVRSTDAIIDGFDYKLREPGPC